MIHNTLVQYRSVHNTLVQYGKGSTMRSTIYLFNTENDPQYISSIQKSVHNTLVNMDRGPQYIRSIIWKRVHNILVQYGKGSTIHYFNTEKGPQ